MPRPAPAQRGDHVLIVDDDEEVAAILREFLEGEGYVVTTAASCASARGRLSSEGFALVLLDLVLPDGAGGELLSTISAAPDRPDVFIVTGQATLESAIAAADAGAAGYILKPLDLEQLGRRLQRLVEHRRLAREHAMLSERRREAEALAEVGRLLSQTLDFDVVAKSIIEHVARLLVAPSAAVYALDPATRELRIVSGWTSFESGFFWSAALKFGTGVVGAALTRREAFATPDMLHDPSVTYTDIRKSQRKCIGRSWRCRCWRAASRLAPSPWATARAGSFPRTSDGSPRPSPIKRPSR